MKSTTKKLVSCALCIAIGVLLPMAFHVIPNAGSIFLPMHIPVLICGLFCGAPYGLACGIITPFLSSMTTGMPPAMILPQMMIELAVYGLVTGLCLKTHQYQKRNVKIIHEFNYCDACRKNREWLNQHICTKYARLYTICIYDGKLYYLSSWNHPSIDRCSNFSSHFK